MKNSWKILLLAICVVSVSACSSKSSDDTLNSVDEVEQVAPPETIYNEAEALLKKKNYRSAIEKFQEVERLGANDGGLYGL
jgi:outer membrane protein assembly factor BamD (BamD/ComL family)